MSHSTLSDSIAKRLINGLAIPAHPLALDHNRKFDEDRQRALSRYYCAAGAGGLAVGVHTTQFAIHNPDTGLYRPVLELAAEVMDEHTQKHGVPLVKIAGIVGETRQATREAQLARDLGYHMGLLSLGGLHAYSNEQLLDHVREVASVIPVFGFYLQAAVGGRLLDAAFWKQMAGIENLRAIKIAPFNRYQTLDVVRAVAESGRSNEIALYTGNDDHIVLDLLTGYQFEANSPILHISGGLLGQWAVWTKNAAKLVDTCRSMRANRESITPEMCILANQLTDANAALFDAANHFHGCIAGLHEILRRQGLMTNRYTLDPAEDLSPGQLEEIDRVCRAYPHLNDDLFVKENLDAWLS